MNKSPFESEVERQFQEPLAGLDTTALERNALREIYAFRRSRSFALARATLLGVASTFVVFHLLGPTSAEVVGFRSFVSEVSANALSVMSVGSSPVVIAVASFVLMSAAAGYAIREN